MPQFKPFKGIRPVKQIAGLFATKSVDSYNAEDLERELTENPHSFLHIIKPAWEINFLETNQKHELVRENLNQYLESGNSEKDKPSFYIYQVSKPSKENPREIFEGCKFYNFRLAT